MGVGPQHSSVCCPSPFTFLVRNHTPGASSRSCLTASAENSQGQGASTASTALLHEERVLSASVEVNPHPPTKAIFEPRIDSTVLVSQLFVLMLTAGSAAYWCEGMLGDCIWGLRMHVLSWCVVSFSLGLLRCMRGCRCFGAVYNHLISTSLVIDA